MKGILYLAWRYLRHRPLRTMLLVVTVALMIFLPLAVRVFVEESGRLLRLRAETTPLLVGPRGSSVDLTLASLYFLPQQLEPLEFIAYKRLRAARQGLVVPLHVRFHAGGAPIVGTTLAYFEQRGLEPAEGRLFTRLGDCVIGAEVARARGLGVGDRIISSPDNVFDLGGGYPLKMRVTGVLAEANNPDDEAVFVDVKTAWVIEGLAHGHDDAEEGDVVLSRDEEGVRFNAALREYREVTDENLGTFHFHGNQNTYPITSLIVFPESDKARAILLGRHEGGEATEQAVIPVEAVGRLAETLFSTRKIVFYGFLALALASAVLVVLVFLLSLRLRQREMTTYRKIGMSGRRLLCLKLADALVVVTAGAAIALGGVRILDVFAPSILQSLL